MQEKDYLIRRKLSLLQLADEISNIRQACNIFGVSRQHYYDLKNNYEKYGVDGLKPKERQMPDMPNKVSNEVENKIIEYSLNNPTYGKDRVAISIRLEGIWTTPSGVQSIWDRNKMSNRKQRLKMLETKMQDEGFFLSESQIAALAQNFGEVSTNHVISHYPGYLLCQDTFEVGYIKGIGKIYMQAVIDTYGSFGFAKLYTSKVALASADILIDRVLPFYYALGIPVQRVLTDNGKEYCGDSIKHDYELILKYFNIKHKRTKIRHPQTNGFVERFNRTILEEFFVVAFRTNWFTSVEELQNELDKYLLNYNFYRPHQGYRTKGKIPIEILYQRRYDLKLLTT